MCSLSQECSSLGLQEVQAWLPSLSPFALTFIPCVMAPEPSGLKPLLAEHLVHLLKAVHANE